MMPQTPMIALPLTITGADGTTEIPRICETCGDAAYRCPWASKQLPDRYVSLMIEADLAETQDEADVLRFVAEFDTPAVRQLLDYARDGVVTWGQAYRIAQFSLAAAIKEVCGDPDLQ
jgi:hypothetical protein